MRSGSLAISVLLSLVLAAPAAGQIPLGVPTGAVGGSPIGTPIGEPTSEPLGAPEPAERSAAWGVGGGLLGVPTTEAGTGRRSRASRPALGFCADWQPERFQRNPSREELRCRHQVDGPGRFGLLSYIDLPVYQPATPMPGTHLAGVPGHAQPLPGETFEEWEWRVHRTEFPAHTRVANSSLELLDPAVAARVMALERRLAEEGIRFVRRETWRHPERQAFLFQQGRSRPGPIATTTLTSWHGQVDERGLPAGRAVDYTVPWSRMERFHEIARDLGLSSFGADSHDPGHVFLPPEEHVAAVEIQMLRLLPRVPEVTLATGLPVDRSLPFGGRAQLRDAVTSWLGGPFVPYLLPRVSGAIPKAEPVLDAVEIPAAVKPTGRQIRRRGAR
jgi:hypothetical protein